MALKNRVMPEGDALLRDEGMKDSRTAEEGNRNIPGLGVKASLFGR